MKADLSAAYREMGLEVDGLVELATDVIGIVDDRQLERAAMLMLKPMDQARLLRSRA